MLVRYERLVECYDVITRQFPSKIRIFLFAFYIWTWILFQLTRVTNMSLGLIIAYLPTMLMPSVSHKAPIKIIRATDDKGNEMTKQLEMFMKFKWDKSMCDDHGGIDLDVFVKYIGSSIVWIAYIMDYDIDDNTCNRFLSMVEDLNSLDDDKSDATIRNNKLTVNHFKKCVRLIVINTGKKIVHKLNGGTAELVPEDILFGEIDFF